MEVVIHNAAELGQLAKLTRAGTGLRIEDLHDYTQLATRFIGEIERGKETAQLGKVMDMLNSMGLELVVRTKLDETMVDPRSLGLAKGRFWSSSNQLPAYRIMARVLADPIEDDLQILKQRFGLSSILATWSELRTRGEVSESVIPITQAMLRKLATPPTGLKQNPYP